MKKIFCQIISMKIQETGVISDLTRKDAILLKEIFCQKFALYDLNSTPQGIESLKQVVVIGGDGFLLDVMHQFLSSNIAFYGINYGTIGFLLNEKFEPSDLPEKLLNVEETKLPVIISKMEQADGKVLTAYAINEISLFRESGQVIKVRIYIDGKKRMEELVGDGIVLSTFAGSTAYNFSLHGPVLPPSCNMLSLCPISPFRPRHWRGALIEASSTFEFEVIESQKRPVLATADFHHYSNIIKVHASLSEEKYLRVLFDKNKPLKEKIRDEQFFI